RSPMVATRNGGWQAARVDLSARALSAHFSRVGDAWRLAFRLQWDAFVAGEATVGAVLVDGGGAAPRRRGLRAEAAGADADRGVRGGGSGGHGVSRRPPRG